MSSENMTEFLWF